MNAIVLRLAPPEAIAASHEFLRNRGSAKTVTYPASVRRARRDVVEKAMIAGVEKAAIVRAVSELFGCHPFIVYHDHDYVEARWRRESSQSADRRREAAIRRTQRRIAVCDALGDATGAAANEKHLALLLGIGPSATTNFNVIDARRQSQEIHVHAPSDDLLASALRILDDPARKGLGPAARNGLAQPMGDDEVGAVADATRLPPDA